MLDNNEELNKGFSSIYDEYDKLSSWSVMSVWRRGRVYDHLQRHLKSKTTILELNSGSGIDAVYLAKKGFDVFATDISDGFVGKIKNKIHKNRLEDKIKIKQLSFERLADLKGYQFDAIYSNFGGLNCTNNLDKVISSFSLLLEKDGIVTLVIMPPKAPWEWLWLLKGSKKAFRRFSKRPIKAKIEGHVINTWYHSYSKLKKLVKNDFEVIEVENLGFFVPPNDNFPLKYPNLFNFLAKIDDRINKYTPNGVGDYYILTLRKK